MRKQISLTLASLLTAACTSQPVASANITAEQTAAPNNEVILASEIKWQQLNPARGDMSPQAGTLWGDREGAVATGFLAKFVDGFSSPPHIHNVTYRAVVISGTIHNDDPNATDMWMPSGSFWTQPKGEVHITAAKGSSNVALVEIDHGPYLVLPTTEAFDSGERPINVDASNLVWVDPPGISISDNGPKLSYLWGNLSDGQSNGSFLKLPARFSGKMVSQGSVFRAVIIKGQAQLGTDNRALDPGSYFGSQGETLHHITSKAKETIIYIRTDGKYEIIQD